MYCTHGAATEIISWQIVESKLHTTTFSTKKKKKKKLHTTKIKSVSHKCNSSKDIRMEC